MARINTYSKDTTVQKNDKLLGSNADGTTRNFSIEDISTFQANTNAGAVIGQLPYVYHNSSFGGNLARQSGSITIDTLDASTAFSSVTTIKVSKFPYGYENDAVAVINAFLNKEIIIASQDTPNNFGIFTCTAVAQDSVETDFYDLTLTYSSGNGDFVNKDFYSVARYIGSDLNTTYDLSVPSATTSIRLAGSDSTNDDITITGSGTTTVTRTSGTELTINSTDQYTGTVTGTGTTNYLSKFTGSSAIGDSVIFDNGTNVGIGTASPTQDLHVDGNARITGAIYDSNNEPGTSGQILSSTATGTDWIDQSTIAASSAESVEVPVKNVHTALITKGTPVYIFGSVGSSGILEVKPADASVSGSMPALGLLKQDLTPNAEGSCVTAGKLRNLITSPIDGATPVEGDVIYVKSGGGLTTTKPQGSSNLIQNMGKVGVVSTSNNGTFVVSSILRTNDIPNLTTGKIWVGDGNTIESATVHLDETNTRLGVGTTTPSVTLDVNGAGRFNGVIRSNFLNNYDNSKSIIGAPSNYVSIYDGSGVETVRVDASGNVGIGTTSPLQKLHVIGSIKTSNKLFLGGNTDVIDPSSNSGMMTIGSNQPIRFTNASTTEYARITTSGNVGIGTTSPGAKLNVEDANGNDTAGNGVFKISAASNAGHQFGFRLDAGAKNLHIDTNYGGTDYTAAYITRSNRHFGIGVLPNDARLQVKGAGSTSSTTALLIQNSSTTNLLTVLDDGNVGIGTTSPGQKLTVEGNIELGTGGYIYGDTTTPYVRLNNAAGAELAYGASNRVSVGGPTTIISSAVDVARFRSNKVIFTQPLFVGTSDINDTPTAELQVKGSGSTSSTSSLLVQNSATTEIFRVRDDGSVYGIGAGGVDTNAAYGKDALINNTTAASNVAVGYQAMLDATTGGFNVAVGELALSSNTTATNSVAIGRRALQNANVNQLVAVGSYAGSAHTTGAQSTYLGYAAGGATTTGGSNTAVGSGALNLNVTGSNNTAVGKEALYSNTVSLNTAVGFEAGKDNTTGTQIVALGAYALTNNTIGNYNVGVGSTSMFANTTGTSNVAIGWQSSYANTTGNNNTGVGHGSLRFNTGSNHVALGYQASYNNTTAADNVSIGYRALYTNSTGASNVAVGKEALRQNTAGGNNVAVGQNSLRNNQSNFNTSIGHDSSYNTTTGNSNVAIGKDSFYTNTTGSNNVAVGTDSLKSSSTGASNVAIGKDSLRNNTASDNTAVGYQAAYNNTTGNNNVAIGKQTFQANTQGSFNVALGNAALYANTTGQSNTAIGQSSLSSNTTGANNVAIGRDSLRYNTASSGTAVGYQALYNNTSGANNTAVGKDALKNNTTGTRNTAIGENALETNTTGSYITAVGMNALAFNTASESTAVGYDAMVSNTTGVRNTALGYRSLKLNVVGRDNTAIGSTALEDSSGSENTAIGSQALQQNTTASQNTAVGYRALQNNTTGVANTSVGDFSLNTNQTGTRNNAFGFNSLRTMDGGIGNAGFGNETFRSTTTGVHNIGMGDYAGYHNTTGSNNIALGYRSNFTNTTGGNNVAVGYQALYNNTASSNAAIGYQALFSNTTGSTNTAIGVDSSRSNTTAANNTSIGYRSAYANTTGANNVSIGVYANNLNVTGTGNTAVGYGAGQALTSGDNNTFIGNAGNTKTAGSQNIAIGNLSLRAGTSDYNISIGYYNQFSNTTGGRNTAIGHFVLQSNTTGEYNSILGWAAGGTGTGDQGSSNCVLGTSANTGNFNSSVILGRSATATASNQFVVGSSSYNAGAVTTETITADKTWTVKINGTDYKIPIVAA
jgi:hypothetical protein